ncbi:alpha/beta fold hydrolase [Nonomuraea sp. NN258]|uniref:alpha/beta fold hydrolase n=1 Tax=Nonomuraea antri TaxID=2730852 RepID=UPI001569A139|nr:alpha/beta hydrolase [Nonomuraea antri]NRQ40676.1 alpha/beta fold hydrolase [Nonomuraea antri]
MTQETVRSADGTTIAYHRQGDGPAVILVGGGLDDGTENVPLAAELATTCTVLNYARRGRAGSGDTPPYALEREIEDLAALLAVAGDRAHLFGASSGGALALEAAAAGLPVGKIAVYEVPYLMGDDVLRQWCEYVAELHRALAAGRNGDAVALFMRLAGAGDEAIAGARSAPFWPSLEALAPTLAYDAACLGDGRPSASRFAAITQPVLVITGAGDPNMPGLPADFFTQAADALTATLPTAHHEMLAGQGHVADPKALATTLTTFYAT